MKLHEVINDATRAGDWQRGRAIEWLDVTTEAMTLADVPVDETAIAMMVVSRARRAANAARSQAAEFGIDGSRQQGLERSARRWNELALAIEARVIRHYERLADAAREVA